jgi:hypothetical protein
MTLDLMSQLVPALVTGSVALFAYLVKSYFQKIHDSNVEVKQEIAKLEGKLDLLMKDIRDNTIESVTMRSEVKALWRFVDNSNKRPTDRKVS